MSSAGQTTHSVRLPEPASALDAVERTADGGREREGLVALDRNERLAPLPESFIAELRGAIDSNALTEYPATDRLYGELGESLGLPREQLLLTPGSDAAFRALAQVYAGPDARVVTLEPSYRTYPVYAQMAGAEVTAVEFEPDLTLDTARLMDALEPGVGLVFLANPNQPTGTSLEPEVVRSLLERAGEIGALVSIDEAYYPFSRQTSIGLLKDHPNLVVTRTFSKAWGLAGLRVGLVAAEPEVVRNLFKVRSVYDINSVAVLCVRKLLAHPEIAEDYVAEVDAGRELLAGRARDLGLEPLPSETNFMQIRVSDRIDPAALAEALQDRGYLVKHSHPAPCLAGCIRVTLGPPELMSRFADALEEVLA